MNKPSADIVTRFSIAFCVLSLVALAPFIETVLSPGFHLSIRILKLDGAG